MNSYGTSSSLDSHHFLINPYKAPYSQDRIAMGDSQCLPRANKIGLSNSKGRCRPNKLELAESRPVLARCVHSVTMPVYDVYLVLRFVCKSFVKRAFLTLITCLFMMCMFW